LELDEPMGKNDGSVAGKRWAIVSVIDCMRVHLLHEGGQGQPLLAKVWFSWFVRVSSVRLLYLEAGENRVTGPRASLLFSPFSLLFDHFHCFVRDLVWVFEFIPEGHLFQH
jgi:hypothetical protein